MDHEAANFPDPVDRAAQEEEFSLELRNRDRERGHQLERLRSEELSPLEKLPEQGFQLR